MAELDPVLVGRLGLALGLGLLVGAQRERAHGQVAGLRTFGIVGLFGGFTAALLPWGGAWLLAAGLLATLALMVVGAREAHRPGEPDPGQTTEFAALLTYCIGAWAVLGDPATALVFAGAMVVLLQAKARLHAAVLGLGENDFRAIVQLVLVALVGLPLVPDWSFGPDGVVGLRNVAWMIVLIAAISLAGYFAWRAIGRERGLLVAGLLGGLISSTATTVGIARQSRQVLVQPAAAAAMVALATAVVWLRVLVEVAVVAPRHLGSIGLPLLALALTCAAIAFWSWQRIRARAAAAHPIEHRNPAQLGTAFGFGLMYGLVLLAVAWIGHHLDARWLYPVAFATGLTDMDAITLSTARLAEVGSLPPATAWRLIAVAFLGNLVFKTVLGAVLGGAALLRELAPPLLMMGIVVVVAVLLGGWL